MEGENELEIAKIYYYNQKYFKSKEMSKNVKYRYFNILTNTPPTIKS